MSACGQTVTPTVNETPNPCQGLYTPTSCVKASVANTYFSVITAEDLDEIITKIATKVQAIENNTVLLSTLVAYADDAAAGTGGVVTGKAYKDTLGYIRIKL